MDIEIAELQIKRKWVNDMAKNFEGSIKELEEIAEKLSDGEVSLDEAIGLFENGMKLSKSCQKMLEDAEKKVNILLEKDGEIKKQPFESEEE